MIEDVYGGGESGLEPSGGEGKMKSNDGAKKLPGSAGGGGDTAGGCVYSEGGDANDSGQGDEALGGTRSSGLCNMGSGNDRKGGD